MHEDRQRLIWIAADASSTGTAEALVNQVETLAKIEVLEKVYQASLLVCPNQKTCAETIKEELEELRDQLFLRKE